MKEIVNSVTEIAKNRLTNSLYGTFILSWIVFHWNFIFSLIALNDTKVMQFTGMLKNDYLSQKYFNISDWYFWISWIMPFVFTYIIIWKLPEWVLLKAYKKSEEYETEKKIIKISQERRVEQEETKLEEQTVKKVTAVAKQVVEEKKIKDINPTIDWDVEYIKFKELGYHIVYSSFVNAFYSGTRYLTQNNPSDMSYFDALGLIQITDNKIDGLTIKGKYFSKKAKEDIGQF